MPDITDLPKETREKILTYLGAYSGLISAAQTHLILGDLRSCAKVMGEAADALERAAALIREVKS